MAPDPREPLPMVPPALAADLEALNAAPPVPADVDQLIVMNAERALDAQARRRQNRFRIQRLAAAAAAVAVFTLVGSLIARRMAVRPRSAADVDGNGVVNILDAYRLAKRLDAPGQGAFDVNGDGNVDRADVDAIAMRAVRLGGGS